MRTGTKSVFSFIMNLLQHLLYLLCLAQYWSVLLSVSSDFRWTGVMVGVWAGRWGRCGERVGEKSGVLEFLFAAVDHSFYIQHIK